MSDFTNTRPICFECWKPHYIRDCTLIHNLKLVYPFNFSLGTIITQVSPLRYNIIHQISILMTWVYLLKTNLCHCSRYICRVPSLPLSLPHFVFSCFPRSSSLPLYFYFRFLLGLLCLLLFISCNCFTDLTLCFKYSNKN